MEALWSMVQKNDKHCLLFRKMFCVFPVASIWNKELLQIVVHVWNFCSVCVNVDVFDMKKTPDVGGFGYSG